MSSIETFAPTSPLSDNVFGFFKKTAQEVAGIHFSDSKRELVKTRLRQRLDRLGMTAFEEYQNFLQSIPEDHEEWQHFINRLTTNKTDFFREPQHFEFLVKEFLPNWIQSGEKTLKIWCAASSTGEEVYTLSVLLLKHLPKDRSFKILATDIDTQVLAHGQNGVYPKEKMGDIPEAYHSGSVSVGTGEVQGWFRFRPEVQANIVWKKHNLVEASYVGDEVFDLIFCRNVLIYFSPDTVAAVASKLRQSLKPGGLLFIGHSESLGMGAQGWKTTRPSVYRKVNE